MTTPLETAPMVLARSSIRATSAYTSTFPAIASRSIVADTHNLASAPTRNISPLGLTRHCMGGHLVTHPTSTQTYGDGSTSPRSEATLPPTESSPTSDSSASTSSFSDSENSDSSSVSKEDLATADAFLDTFLDSFLAEQEKEEKLSKKRLREDVVEEKIIIKKLREDVEEKKRPDWCRWYKKEMEDYYLYFNSELCNFIDSDGKEWHYHIREQKQKGRNSFHCTLRMGSEHASNTTGTAFSWWGDRWGRFSAPDGAYHSSMYKLYNDFREFTETEKNYIPLVYKYSSRHSRATMA